MSEEDSKNPADVPDAAPAEEATKESTAAATETTEATDAALVQAQEEAELKDQREKKEASEELTKRLQKLALDRQKVSTRVLTLKSQKVLNDKPSSNELLHYTQSEWNECPIPTRYTTTILQT